MPACQNTSPEAPVSIFAVVVLYRSTPVERPSVLSLLEASLVASDPGLRLHIRLADNTPGGQVIEDLPDGVEFCAYPANPGLALPYNEALHAAEQQGYEWLLTLDQDTGLPPNFLTCMAREARRYAPCGDVSAIVPHIVDGGRPISPFCYRAGFLPVVLPLTRHGLAPQHASAINSGSLVRCSAVHDLGGYDAEFPLHNSDTRLFQRIDQAGKRVAIAAVTVPHELSILQREKRISPERYRHMLQDERSFWNRHMGPMGRAERLVRLTGRAVKGLLRGEDQAFQRITLQELRRRLW